MLQSSWIKWVCVFVTVISLLFFSSGRRVCVVFVFRYWQTRNETSSLLKISLSCRRVSSKQIDCSRSLVSAEWGVALIWSHHLQHRSNNVYWSLANKNEEDGNWNLCVNGGSESKWMFVRSSACWPKELFDVFCFHLRFVAREDVSDQFERLWPFHPFKSKNTPDVLFLHQILIIFLIFQLDPCVASVLFFFFVFSIGHRNVQTSRQTGISIENISI